MSPSRRVVMVCCDGVGRNWITNRGTPLLWNLKTSGLWCDDHHAVFPSVTRVSAASIATGCNPGHHGLHGNRMGLIENGRIVVRDVGLPDFRSHMRHATGTTLRRPTMAERVAGHGGFIAFSNVSPGAAYFLDPEHFGHVYHRAGSFAPGGVAITGADALAVSHDSAGDNEMTERFCREVLRERRPAIALLWLCDPDHTLHGNPLGSPAHIAALGNAERCAQRVLETVEGLRGQGEDILLMVCSDHGQETIGDVVDLEAWLALRGLGDAVSDGDIAVASQGTAALLYATDRGNAPLLACLEAMRRESWCDGVLAGKELAERGLAPDGGIAAAVNMASRADSNSHGVKGMRWTVGIPGKQEDIGCGQHGGWGRDETRPFLIVNHPDRSPAELGHASTLEDIAPTALAFLGLAPDAMDGRPLPPFQSGMILG
jgi:hypothetical protein